LWETIVCPFLGGGTFRFDFLVLVNDVTDVNNPTERERFWIEKLNSYVPRGLNSKEEV
jgi:hypothetical protein